MVDEPCFLFRCWNYSCLLIFIGINLLHMAMHLLYGNRHVRNFIPRPTAPSKRWYSREDFLKYNNNKKHLKILTISGGQMGKHHLTCSPHRVQKQLLHHRKDMDNHNITSKLGHKIYIKNIWHVNIRSSFYIIEKIWIITISPVNWATKYI